MHLWLIPLLLLIVHAIALGPLAPELEGSRSVRVLDRAGQTLADVRDERSELALPLQPGELSPWVEPALLAAEDARFYHHPGIDPLAMLRAAAQALANGRVVSGGSTLTQQLARTLFERPRTLWGKWRECAYALRLEAELDKPQILAAYLDRVHFGPRIRGIGAAARYYFDKPASALSLAESAALVASLQGPSRLDPERHPERLERRRNRVLARMLELGFADSATVVLAQRTPLSLHRGLVLPGAFHFVRAAVTGKLGDVSAAGSGASVTEPGRGQPAAAPAVLRSTLDSGLQREVEQLVQSFDARFAEHRASAAAVLVVDNRSCAVRAYVGSPDHRADAALGQNDGVLALRQPGSTLKPFVYALALQDLGLNAASSLPDLERSFESSDGEYLPHNYDRRFHGPVRLAQALAASLNVPAVTLADQLGPDRVLELLRDLGFAHLRQAGSYYGPAIALGVGEVQLRELAAAYATLGRGGSYLPLRYFETESLGQPRRVLPEAVARQIISILSDPRERAASFGRDGPLEFDVPVAVKTGTSKGNRDNWAVGVGEGVTAAIWVGNFDGSPMLRSSGATGAGPLFHEVMNASLRRLTGGGAPASRVAASYDAPPIRVCALSGLLAGPDCPHRLNLDPRAPGAPRATCTWHERRCTGGASATCGVVERLPARYASWAHDSGRAPERSAVGGGLAAGSLRIVFPRARQRFVLDQRVSPAQQQVVLRAEASGDAPVLFEVDGARVCDVGLPHACPWSLERGRHQLIVQAGLTRSEPISFSVE